jgi:hypothetical protein
VPVSKAKRNLTAFLRGLNQDDGVHLLIACAEHERSGFCRPITRHSPRSFAATKCQEYFRPKLAEWGNRSGDTLARYGMQFSGYACTTTLNGAPGYTRTSCSPSRMIADIFCLNIRSDVLVLGSCYPRGTYFIYTLTYSRIAKCRVCNPVSSTTRNH